MVGWSGGQVVRVGLLSDWMVGWLSDWVVDGWVVDGWVVEWWVVGCLVLRYTPRLDPA